MVKHKLILGLIIAAVLAVGVSCTKGDGDTSYYSLERDEDGSYILTLYDQEQETIHQEVFPREPVVDILENNIVKISISLGSPNNYTYFYDVGKNIISDVYYNPLLIENEKIVYMEGNSLIVSHIIDKTIVYAQIERNFSPTAEPSLAILKVEFVDSNTLHIEYFEGSDFDEKSEVIDL